jgi:hypothetical protein
MTAHSLPDRLDHDQLRRQAKELRNAGRDGAPDALARFAVYRPAGVPVTLAAAQLVIARASWASRGAPLGVPRSTSVPRQGICRPGRST